MAHSHSHAAPPHASGHSQDRNHDHTHSHPPHAHPAQPVTWSLLRMPALARLGLALAISALLWGAVLLAIR